MKEMKSFPVPDAGLPALPPLLDGDLWARWAAAGRVFPLNDFRQSVSYFRLKPGVSCRIAVFEDREQPGAKPPAGFLLHLFADAARAREAFQKEETRRHWEGEQGWTPFLEEDPAVLAIPFPNDPDLPDLRHFYDLDRFRRLIPEFLPEYSDVEWRVQRQLIRTRLLAYKPGRRAVVAAKVKLRHRQRDEKRRVYLHAKLGTRKFIDRAYRNAKLIHEAARAVALRVPAPCGLPAREPILATEWIDGLPVGQLEDDRAIPTQKSVGEALARFHGLELELDHLPSPPELGERMMALGTDIGRVVPEHAELARDLAGRIHSSLHRLALSASAIVHGDFHPGQTLWCEDAPVIVDLDQAGRGYAALDLGSYVAQLEEMKAQPELVSAFLDGYRETASSEVDPDLVAIATATAIFRRALVPLRELHDQWPQEIQRQLVRCDETLRRCVL